MADTRHVLQITWGLLLTIGLMTTLHAQDLPNPQPSTTTSLDPMLELALQWSQLSGPLASDFSLDHPLGVLLKLRPEATLPVLRDVGIEVDACVELVCAGELTWSALPHLLENPSKVSPLLERLEVAWSPAVLLPLNESTSELGVDLVHQHPVTPFTGKGVLVADFDSGVDPLHPSLFHADAGRFTWIDVDQDQRLTPGVDGIDLNQNNEIDFNETLRVLDGTIVEDFSTSSLRNNDQVFDARYDWLYVDFNRNSQRDAGVDAGFIESDPGYGEPLFVLDDFNHNTTLDPFETLVGLGTSKVVRYVRAREVYERGRNLIDASTEERQRNGAFHGTAVAGILLGGQRGYHDLVGVAPGANLMMFGYLGEDGRVSDELRQTPWQLRYLAQVMQTRADIILHEWTDPFIQPLDGSTLLEEAIDRMSDRSHVMPLGNLNVSKKHTIVNVPQGVEVQMPFFVPQKWRQTPIKAVVGSLQWQGVSRDVTLHLQGPRGIRYAVEINTSTPTSLKVAGVDVKVIFERTKGGTFFGRFFMESRFQDETVGPGEWAFVIKSESEALEVVGRISDLHSGWSQSVRWMRETQDRMTLSYPATMNTAIGVAAVGVGADQGTLRDFSGHGPTLDGRTGAWIAAPDSPYAPVAQTRELEKSGWGASWYGRFGGTSGAAPHVVGSLALLLEQQKRSPKELRALLTQGVSTPVSNARPDVGWGVLDVWTLLIGGARPVASNSLEVDVMTLQEPQHLVLDATASTGWSKIRFDLDGDGTFESGWQSTPVWRTRWEKSALPGITRVEIQDALGNTAGKIVVWGGKGRGERGVEQSDEFVGGCVMSAGAGSFEESENFWLGLMSMVMLMMMRRRRGTCE